MNLAPLAPLFARPGPWASVYLDMTPGGPDMPPGGADTTPGGPGTTPATGSDGPAGSTAAAHRPSNRRGQDATAARVLGELAAQGADEATCRAVEDALTALLREPPYPAAHFGTAPAVSGTAADPVAAPYAGRALFAAHGEVVLDPPLTVRPDFGSSVTWGALPHLAPLLENTTEDPLCLVAYLRPAGAEFEVRGGSGPASEGSAEAHAGSFAGRLDSGPIADGGHSAGTVAEADRADNALAVARALEECAESTGAGLVVLAGEPDVRRAVQGRLPQHLHPSVVEVDAATGGMPLAEVEVEHARRRRRDRRTAEELERFLDARTPTSGRADATEGVSSLVDAAREHRISELVLSPGGPDTHLKVWVGTAPDQLALRREQAQYLGAADPVPARVDDALLRSAAMSGAEAVLVHPHPGDPAPLGGLGALLRGPGERVPGLP